MITLPMSTAEFRKVMSRLGLGVTEAARLWGVDKRRVARWYSGEEDVPTWTALLLYNVTAAVVLRNAMGANISPTLLTLVNDTIEETIGHTHRTRDEG